MSETALSVPMFRRYFAGAVSGVNGMWIFRVLLSWLAWDLTGSPPFVGLVAACSLLPVAVAGPIMGAVTDRADIRQAFRRVSAGLLVCPLLLLGVMQAGVLSPPVLVAIALSFGTVMALYHPVRQSIGPRLVDGPLIASVVALSALNFNLGRVIAPALGGVLIARAGVEVTALVVTALFVPNLVLQGALRPRQTAPRDQTALWADFRDGLVHALGSGPIRSVLILSVTGLGPVRAVMELLALIADGQFQRGVEGLGLMTSAVGAGALVAALVQVWGGARLASRHWVRWAALAMGFSGTLMLVWAPSFSVSVTAAVIAGFCGTYVGVGLQIWLQSDLDDGLRGRIMSLWMLAVTASTSLMALGLSLAASFWGLGVATVCLLVVCAAVGIAWGRPQRG